jgi:hypothetical protein
MELFAGGANGMMLSKETQDLAQRLLKGEAYAAESSESDEGAAIRVSEKLRRLLSPLVGTSEYCSFVARALTLAQEKAPSLDSVKVIANGSLKGLRDAVVQSEDKHAEAGVILIAQLLEAFCSFLGTSLTRQLVHDSSPHLAAEKKVESEGYLANVLDDVERLKSVCQSLETLGGQHPNVEISLLSIAWTIRNSATLLEVFALVKERSAKLAEETQGQQSERYLM